MVAEFKFCKRLDKNTTSIPPLEATHMKTLSLGLFPRHISKSGPLASCFMSHAYGCRAFPCGFSMGGGHTASSNASIYFLPEL